MYKANQQNLSGNFNVGNRRLGVARIFDNILIILVIDAVVLPPPEVELPHKLVPYSIKLLMLMYARHEEVINVDEDDGREPPRADPP